MLSTISKKKNIKQFVSTVQRYYKLHGRSNLPWRETKNPYKILVSEVMLQQTQVDRVIPKYHSFLKLFPTVQHLAHATQDSVLKEWQGLGYNRRARFLHQSAKHVVSHLGGLFPRTHEGLIELPGIGPYTAGAILAFAFNKPFPIIETNIRTVFIHHFFNNDADVTDTEIMKIAEKALDLENPSVWFWALMDYGVYLKKTVGNKNTQSKHYTKQSFFKGSDRQIRGAIMRVFLEKSETRKSLHKKLAFEHDRIDALLERLREEQMITQRRHMFTTAM